MPDLTLEQAAKAVGASPNSVRTWTKSDPRLQKAVTRKGRGLAFDAAALKALRAVKAERYASAGPALRAAWAARAAGKGNPKRSAAVAQGRKTKPATTKPRRRSGGGKSDSPKKPRAFATAIRLKRPAATLDTVLAGLRRTLEQSTRDAQERLRQALRSVLMEQRSLIDRALKELG